MLAQERHRQILNLIEEKGTVRTIDLANEFEVTDETIRRDLQILSENFQINKIHGGATSLSARPKLQSFIERRAINVEKKKLIGQAALKFVEPGETVAFDSSTTVFELVCALPDCPVRVVTNTHSVIHQLLGHEQIELISTGGRYQPKTQTFIGIESQASLRRHNVNKAFISCVGLDLRQGASEGFEDQAIFKDVLLQTCEEVILLVDSSKMGQRSEYFFAAPEQISCVITDKDADVDFLEKLKGSGIEVVVADGKRLDED